MSAVRYRLFNIFAATLYIWRPFLHPEPEDAPCRDDGDPLITGKMKIETVTHTGHKAAFDVSTPAVTRRMLSDNMTAVTEKNV
jgi:hypothetical protein